MVTRRWKIITLAAALLAGVVGVAYSSYGPVHAQDPDAERYVDLAVDWEIEGSAISTARVHMRVANFGKQTAYDVEVVMLRPRHQTTNMGFRTVPPPNGTVNRQNPSRGFTWTIPEFPPQTEYLLSMGYSATNPNRVFKYSATVTATGSHEPENRLDNNSATIWHVHGSSTGTGQGQPDHRVEVSVDNRHPAPGDTVNFTVKAVRDSVALGVNRFAEGCVNVQLTGGLTAGTATFDPATDRSFDNSTTRACGDTSAAAGLFLLPDVHTDLTSTMTLPVTVASDATVNEQCLTAEIFAVPPTGPGRFFDDPHDNRVEVCLDDPPPETFDEGEVRTWTLFACKEGVAANACDTADEVDVRVLASVVETTDEHGDPDEVRVLDNATALIHVKDVPGRVFDAPTNSVTDGTTVSWQTATDEHTDCTGTRAGVKTGLNYASVNDYLNNWTNFLPTFRASGLDGGNPPGNTHVRSGGDCAAYWLLTSATSYTAQLAFTLDLSSVSTPLLLFLDFDELGTYVVEFVADVKHATIDEDGDSETDVFSGTGRTIFHVGPIAELGVGDGGATADAAADQVAFTVAGYNDTGETYESGKIVVELPAGTTGLTTVPPSAGVFDGNASPPTWTWDVHDLEQTGDRRRSNGLPAGIIVTLIVEGVSAGETAAANVVYDPYEVCVASDGTTATASTETGCNAISGASWHSGTVFDLNKRNDSATLTARAGGNLPGTPTLQAPAVYTPAVGFEWDEIQYLYGTLVKHYETEWSSDGISGWSTLTDEVLGIEDLDTSVQAGQARYYRVRAVNQAGVPGPWSAPIRARAEALGFPGVSVSEAALTIAEGESGEYQVSLLARPVSNVTVRINGSGDVSPNPSRLTFTPSNWFTPQTVTLNASQDNDAVDDTGDVTHTVSSSDGAYASLTVDPVVVTVIDDDSGVSITAEQESVNEGEDITLTLTRTGNTSTAIEVTVNVSQRGDVLDSGESGNRTVDLGANTTSAAITVLTDNDTAVESSGTVIANVVGGASYFAAAPSSATVRVSDDDGPPGQPGNLTTVEGDERVELSWNAAPTGDANVPVLDYSYQVRRSDSSTWDPDWTVILGSSLGTRGHTVHDLDNGQDYTIQVRARNATGDGATAEVTANPKDEPGRLDVTVASRNESLLVTWDVPDDGGRPTTEYRVQWKSGGQSFDVSRQATATTREYTIPSLTNGTEYRVRVQARNEVGWGDWSGERTGTPTPRPATTLSITSTAQDGVGEPFRVTFTFTDEDHDGTQYGVTGFGVDDIEAGYGSPSYYELTLGGFKQEDQRGLVYSALVNDVLDGKLTISVPQGAAQSNHDGQQSAAAVFNIMVKPPQPQAPTGTNIWSAEMTVGDLNSDARGYIDHNATQWNASQTIGSLSANEFTYLDKDYLVGELSYVSAWNMIMLVTCPGLEGADGTFELYLDDPDDGDQDLRLTFGTDEVETDTFRHTIGGVQLTCIEYQWDPQQVEWQNNSKVNASIVK